MSSRSPSAAMGSLASADFQKTDACRRLQHRQLKGVIAQKALDEGGRLVAAPEEDDLRRGAVKGGEIADVRVLRDQRVAFARRMSPNGQVIGPVETDQPDLGRAGIKVRQGVAEFVAQVLVKQQLHAAASGRRSDHHAPLAIGGEGEGGGDVAPGQFREIVHDLVGGEAFGQPAQDVGDGDAQAADARLAASLAGLHRDHAAVIVRHGRFIARPDDGCTRPMPARGAARR